MGRTKPSLAEFLLLVALVFAAVAFWAPWVGHATAALKLSGQDLGEFVKFLPGRGPTLPRQLFYVSPLACSVSLVLLAASRETSYRRWVRATMLGVAVLLLSGLLPPVWGHPRELFAPEFRSQGAALIAGLVLVVGHGLLRRLPRRALSAALFGVALLALVLPQAAFWAVRTRIWSVYQTPTVHLGWGIWLHILAWGGALITVGMTGFPEAAQDS